MLLELSRLFTSFKLHSKDNINTHIIKKSFFSSPFSTQSTPNFYLRILQTNLLFSLIPRLNQILLIKYKRESTPKSKEHKQPSRVLFRQVVLDDWKQQSN